MDHLDISYKRQKMSLTKGFSLKNGGVVSFVGGGGKTTLMFKLAKELADRGETVLTTTTTKILKPDKNQSPLVILSNSMKEITKNAENHLKNHPHVSAALKEVPPRGKLVGYSAEFIEQLFASGLFRWVLVEADGAAMRPLKAPASHEPNIPPISNRVVGVIGLSAVGKALEEKWVFRSRLYSKRTSLSMGEPVSESSIARIITHEYGLFKDTPNGAGCFVFLNQADQKGNLERGLKICRCIDRKKMIKIKRILIGQALYKPQIIDFFD